jgi:uncharacterized membrane protein YuzA (DUF378 family)
LVWGDSRVSSFPGSGLEHSATVLILGGIDDLYLAVSAQLIQFLSGQFSALAIAMTVVVGIASLFGIAMFVRLKSSLVDDSVDCVVLGDVDSDPDGQTFRYAS